jgi:hypothetical protein
MRFDVDNKWLKLSNFTQIDVLGLDRVFKDFADIHKGYRRVKRYDTSY